MSTGSKSARISPADGLFRLTSAITRLRTGPPCATTAWKKFRGGGIEPTCARSASSGLRPMRSATSAFFLCTILWSASGAMAERAVIAADAATSTPAATDAWPASVQLLVLVAWALAGIVFAARSGWLHKPVPVRWNLGLFEDQVLIACGVLLSGVVASLVASALGARPDADIAPATSLAALLASSAVTVGTWALLSRNARALHEAPAPSSGSRPARTIAIGVLALALAWPLVALATRAGEFVQISAGGPPVPDVAHTTLTQLRAHASDPFAWLLAIAIVLVTPLAEEVLWRGGVQQALKSAGLPRALALVIASALFALVHWNAVPADARAGALPALLMLGLLFGWLMERTGGLLAAVSAHAAFNAANLLLFSTLPG